MIIIIVIITSVKNIFSVIKNKVTPEKLQSLKIHETSSVERHSYDAYSLKVYSDDDDRFIYDTMS